MAWLKTVKRNGARLAVMLHRFTKEGGRRVLVAGAAQIEVEGLAFGVQSAVQVYPGGGNLNVGLIGTPRSSYWSFVAPPALLEILGIADAHRKIVVCATGRPRSAIISTRFPSYLHRN